ncbi:hypothetical protein G9P44_001098 [Scheffersomyces stipitis]|nr:hypothetical protein G9P44_001098 [Scheffersomyces stipitis]
MGSVKSEAARRPAPHTGQFKMKLSSTESMSNQTSFASISTSVSSDDSPSTSGSSSKPKMKKRKYSRGGCRECKRRKMKCDEGKPHCHNCSRLSKVCVYEQKQKFRFENIQTGGTNDGDENHTSNQEQDNVHNIQHLQSVQNHSHKNQNQKQLSHEQLISPNDQNISVRGMIPTNGNAITMRFYKPEDRESGNFSSSNTEIDTHPTNNSNQHLLQTDTPRGSQPRTPGYNSNTSSPYNKRVPFKNTISDILTPTEDGVTTPGINNDQFNVEVIQTLFDDASVLVNDINGFVALDFADSVTGALGNSDMHYKTESIAENDSNKSESYENHHFIMDEFSNKLNVNTSPYEENGTDSSQSFFIKDDIDLSISNSELVHKTLQHYDLSGPHITYLNSLTKTDLSYHMFPFASSVESNEVIKILLRYSNGCPYLLTSLLAISATFQFNQTGKQVHDYSRNKYIKVCLKTLGEAFANSDRLPNKLANNIERLLLTVLVLTSNFTATTYSQNGDLLNSWKTHLRGAKDLMLKYSQIEKNQKIVCNSAGLALAKSWFFAIESMAGLNSSLGGTLTQKSGELPEDSDAKDDCNNSLFSATGYYNRERNPKYHDALVEIGLLTESQNRSSTPFNLFIGYSVQVIALIQEFIKALDFLRDNHGGQLDSSKIAKIMSLIHETRKNEIAPQVSKKTYIIPSTSPAHPNYPKNRADAVVLPSSAYDRRISSSGEETVYSWFDLSEQLHVDVLYLRLLCTKGLLKLPRCHRLVKDLVSKILKSTFFISSKDSEEYIKDSQSNDNLVETEHFYLSKKAFDTRTIMIQSPLKLCSRLVDDELDFEKIEIFFLGLIKLGNGSALTSLDLLYKFRERARARAKGGNDLIEKEISDEEVITFA